ncbi:MAG: rRNA pseudouridine synthase [Clostridia bacterium]|nr:rRNA pseudouridine synthase [Clostridia bacterium]
MRLQKFLSEAGVASRRKAEEMIRSGLVKVNGKPAQIGDQVDPAHDKVTVAGRRVHPAATQRYLLLNKPRGYVTTTNDELGRKCVTALLNGVQERVYPVGRLDRVSEGALLLTNDGAFANAMMHPKHHVPKTYVVTLRPGITAAQAEQLSDGIELDGRMTAPADVRIVTQEEGRAVAEIILYEGRNRQIRRMCEALGLEVARLRRTAVGPVRLGMLRPGEWRDLTPQEVETLLRAAGVSEKKGATR